MHDHRHAPDRHPPAPPREARFSLLRLAASRRLALALAALVVLWGGVYWALT